MGTLFERFFDLDGKDFEPVGVVFNELSESVRSSDLPLPLVSTLLRTKSASLIFCIKLPMLILTLSLMHLQH